MKKRTKNNFNNNWAKMSAIKISIDIKRKKSTASSQATLFLHSAFNFAFASHRKCSNNICRNKLYLCLKWMRCGHNLVVFGFFLLSLTLSLSLSSFFILQWTYCSVFTYFFKLLITKREPELSRIHYRAAAPKWKFWKRER